MVITPPGFERCFARMAADCQAGRRYLGEDVAREYLTGVDQPGTRMARIDLRPTWVAVYDFRSRLPSALGGISSPDSAEQ